MLGGLVLGFAWAGMIAACQPSKPGTLYAAGVVPTAEPFECKFPPGELCMRYRIPLVGNPTMDVALRNKYIAAFGDACYLAETTNTFDCFYKTWQAACAGAVKIGEVSGNAPYDTGYTCQPVAGSKNYTLQIGPDVANQITITYENAPLQTAKIDVNGTPTAVNGPYRNLPEPANVQPGRLFKCGNQREMILQANRDAHSGKIESDLKDFTYACPEQAPMMCVEPKVLKDPKNTPQNDPDRAQVHHVVRATDQRGCRWGTNSNKNAAVISARLNQYLYNKSPSPDEVTKINAVSPSPP